MIYSNAICDYCMRNALERLCQNCNSFEGYQNFIGKKVEEVIITIKETDK